MDETRLDELIRKLHHLTPEEPETKDCPGFAKLWAHVSSGRPLGTAEGHVKDCQRCQRLLEIMRRELAAAGAGAVLSRPRPLVVRLAVPLAAAACLAIVAWLGWPRVDQPAVVAERLSEPEVLGLIAPCCEQVYLFRPDSQTRGPDGDAPFDAAAMAPDLAKLLAELHRDFSSIQLSLIGARELITTDSRGFLIVKDGLGEERRRWLQRKVVDKANEIRDQLVNVLQVHVPGLEQVPEENIRRALDRWMRNKKVLGD